MKDLALSVNSDLCVRCGLCAQDCPSKVITLPIDGLPTIMVGREEQCIACQHCFAVCPPGALSIFGLNPQDSLPPDFSSLPNPTNMRALVRGRRSTRQYLAQNVPPAVLDDLLEDLQYAPTGQNLRLLEYLVVDKLETMNHLREKSIVLAERALANGLDSAFIKGLVKYYRRDSVDILFRGAPHLLVISAPAKKQSSPQQDIALALAYFELLAASHGLGTCWCGYVNYVESLVPGIRELLGLNEGDDFYSILFGLPSVKYHRQIQREGTAKIRRLV